MKRTLTGCLLMLALATLGAPSAWAQVDTFMLVPGIPGESTDEQHRDWINVLSIRQSWGPEVKKKANVCALEVVKGLDLAGPLLWGAAATGQLFPEVRIEVVKRGAERLTFYVIQLLSPRVTSIVTTGDVMFAEHVMLSADTVLLTFFPQLPDGTPGPPVMSSVACQ